MSIVRNPQALFALLLLVLNTGYFLEALTLPRPFVRGEPGPAFLPLVLSAILFVASGRILYMEMRGIGDAEDEGAGWFAVRPALLALATAGFVYVFEPLGYWVATFLYTSAVAALFESERGWAPLRMAAVAGAVGIAMTAVGWLFFVTLFDLFLPTGNW